MVATCNRLQGSWQLETLRQLKIKQSMAVDEQQRDHGSRPFRRKQEKHWQVGSWHPRRWRVCVYGGGGGWGGGSVQTPEQSGHSAIDDSTARGPGTLSQTVLCVGTNLTFWQTRRLASPKKERTRNTNQSRQTARRVDWRNHWLTHWFIHSQWVGTWLIHYIKFYYLTNWRLIYLLTHVLTNKWKI